MNPSTALGRVFADELARCGAREAVIAPGSRSTPLAMALFDLDRAGRIRLHVRIDERAASFTALGLARASRRPVAVVCTSGTATANFHPAIVEASESGIPLLVLTADRPPELRGAGASQTIDQVKMYGDAVRWYADPGVPERRAGAVAQWRSLACQAYAQAAGLAGTFPGPVHVNLPFREPLVPDPADAAGVADVAAGGGGAAGVAALAGGEDGWPEPLDGRPGGRPWTRFTGPVPGGAAAPGRGGGSLVLPWTERGVVVCGDGDYDTDGLLALAGRAGWAVLAEPSSSARRGPGALTAYQYLLASPEFMAGHRPDVIVSAGRPGLSRPQSALLRTPGARHVVIARGPGHWADQARLATDVATSVELAGAPAATPGQPSRWLASWLRADEAALAAVDAVLDEDESLSEPRVARDLLRAIPDGALLWVGSSMPIRDIDNSKRPGGGIRVLSSRGASGIDGTTSSAIGAALAHQAVPPRAAAGQGGGGAGGPAFALVGDLTFVHDAAGLAIGPGEPRPDLCLVVVNNDGGGIFSTLEQAAFRDSFERLFGTGHGADLRQLAGSFGIPYTRADTPDDLAKALSEAVGGTGLRVIEARTDRAATAALRARLRDAALGALR